MFAGKELETPTIYHIQEELKRRQRQGENVYVELNGAKFYSIDSSDIAELYSFIDHSTGMLEPSYRKSLQKEAQYVSSMGMTADEIATAMAEAHKKGLNVYTYLPEDVLPLGKLPFNKSLEDKKIYAISVPSKEMFYTRAFAIYKHEYDERPKRTGFGDRDMLKQKTQELYDKGVDFIDPSIDSSEWRLYVDLTYSELDGGEKHLEDVIDIMDSLSKQDYEQVAKIALEDPVALAVVIDRFRPGEDMKKIHNAVMNELEREKDGPTQADSD